MAKFEAFRSRPFDITGGGNPGGDPQGGPRGDGSGPPESQAGGTEGGSRRPSHSLLTPVGSADYIVNSLTR